MTIPHARLLAALTLVSCAATVTRTGPPRPPRPPNCDFEVLTILPAAGYEQIGTLDINPGYGGANWPRTAGDLKEKVAEQVCEAGGDSVYSAANTFGAYASGTILKKTSQAQAPAGQTAVESGCQFDTQCKGERVCVNHACVDPVK